jgi:nitrous oxidase accessory protein
MISHPPAALPTAAAALPARATQLTRSANGRLASFGLALLASALFLAALQQPWWFFRLYAPQYPHGLTLVISLQGLSGDVHEIDMLNHYIGMAHLDAAAAFEREYAAQGVAGLVVAVLALSVLVNRKWRASLGLVGALLPLGFIADSFYWLHRFGHELDPRAPLHIPSFTPQLFGNGSIGQFSTFARPELGFWMAVAGAVALLLASVWPSRKWGAALAVTLSACSAHAQAADPASPPSAAGPIAQRAPTAAIVAASSAELAALLADPSGPRDIWLRAQRYDGDFRVARPLALHGESGAAIRGSGHGTVLAIEADGVSVDNLAISHSGRRQTTEDAGVRAKGAGIELRHLRVEDSLFGVSLGPCPRCVIDHVYVRGLGRDVELKGDGIKLWESDDAIVRDCVVDGARDLVVWYSRRALLERNLVSHSRYGSHFMYAHDSIVRDSRIEDNVVGIFVMYSARMHVERNVLAGARGAAGVGIGFKESDAAVVAGNRIIGNSVGTYLDETPRSEGSLVSFRGNQFALNDVGVRFHGTRPSLAFTGNDFDQNTTLAEVEGGGDALSVTFERNHFSDYAGYDLDGDGVGDVPYQLKRLSGELIASHPALAYFQGTTALAALDALATAMPVFANRLLLEDPRPAWTLKEVAP